MLIHNVTDIEEIQTNLDIERILLELSILPEYNTQICLQGVKDSKDPFLGCRVRGGTNSWERKQNHNP